MTTEQRVVAALISQELSDRSPLEQVDWGEVTALVKALGLGPYIYGHLAGTLSNGLPHEFLSVIREQALANSMLALRRQADLRSLATGFRNAEIEWAAVKGIVLAHTAYPSPEMRPMSDVDLLIEPSNLDLAKQILFELGYTQSENAKLAEKMGDHSELAGYISPAGTQMEIHSHLPSLTRMGFAAEEIWGRRVPLRLGDIDGTTLSPEDFLVHLCLHMGAHHGYTGRLHGLLDVAHFVRAKSLDMKGIRGGYGPVVWKWVELTLQLTATILGGEALVEGQPSEALRLAREQLFFVSALPVESHLVNALRSGSIAGWKKFFNRHRELLDRTAGRGDSGLRLSDYPKFAWHRGRYLVRVGMFSRAERGKAFAGKQSKERLMQLMES